MYRDLQTPDKKLVRTLWMLLDDLYNITGNGPKMDRPAVAKNFRKWQSDIDTMLEQLQTSPFNEPSIQLEIAPRPIVDTTVDEKVVTPLPAGLTHEQRNKSLELLLRSNPKLSLTTLLLPTKPVNAATGLSANFHDVITDLAFQLK